jgi:hypothetical protein
MPPVPKREKDRLRRKRDIAKQQAQQFEDELSGHELNLARLDAQPVETRDAVWQQAREQGVAAAAVIKAAISTTLAEADKITDVDVT